MFKVVSIGPVTPLEWVIAVLFVITFSWITLSFTSSIVGFIWLLAHRGRRQKPAPLRERTAVVMPIYNEAPSRVFGAMQAIFEDVERTGQAHAFDFFLISDTTDANVWIAEERAFLAMRARLPQARLYYRRRRKNWSRKAGNISDFVTHWGGRYPHMVVLDADSLMTGGSDRGPGGGDGGGPRRRHHPKPAAHHQPQHHVRAPPAVRRPDTGPVIAAGLSAWMGHEGNYWGHNAIIRTRAFADHCGLPDLPGRPPFGGHILSHDFIEAGLMLRAGYTVYMLPNLGGSYEESPPSLIDLAARDRRWCQGNLQHARIIGARGFTLATRQHLANGIMGYLASPLWMAQLLVGIVLVLQSHYIRPEYFTKEFSLFPAWPRFDYERALQLFERRSASCSRPSSSASRLRFWSRRRVAGPAARSRLSPRQLLEIIISAAFAAIMMLIQSGSVAQILSGRDTGWNPQRRDDGSIPFKSIARRHRAHTAAGPHHAVRRGADLALPRSSGCRRRSPDLSFPFRSPGRAEVWRSASECAGSDYLRTPEETSPPVVVARPTRSPPNSP